MVDKGKLIELYHIEEVIITIDQFSVNVGQFACANVLS